MNDQVEVNEETGVDAEAAVTEAEATVESLAESSKAATAAAKEAKKNYDAAVKYRKSLADDSDGVEMADQSVEGWKAEVDRTAEVSKSTKEELKAARATLRDAKKAAKTGKPARERIEQNGQVRPAEDSRGGKMWAIFDAATAERGSTCAIADVLPQCLELGVTEGSARSSFSHWRKFNGVHAVRS